MRFFRRMGNGALSSSSSQQQQNGSNGGGGERSRHVYPGQRTVVRGNAVQQGRPAVAVVGTAAAAAASSSAPPTGAGRGAISASAYPGHRPGVQTAPTGGSTQGSGAGGQNVVHRSSVTYPPGSAPPQRGTSPHRPQQGQGQGQAQPSQGRQGQQHQPSQPHPQPPPGVQQQVSIDSQGRRVVRYTQHVAAPGSAPPGGGNANAPTPHQQHQQTVQQAQQHMLHQQQQHQQQSGTSHQQGQGQQGQQRQPSMRSTLMGAAGSLTPGAAPTAAGGGIIQPGLHPGGASAGSPGGSAGAGVAPPPPGLGGAGSPMTQQHYHPREHPQPPSSRPGAGAGASAGAGAAGAGAGGAGGAAAPQAQTLSGPGAYSISRNDAGPTQVFRVTVPPGVAPNQEFQVYAGSRVVRVRCPPDTRPGQSLQITVPPDPVVRQILRGMAVLTSVDDAASGEGGGEGGGGGAGGGAVAMREDVRAQNEAAMREEREREERRGRETRERATGGGGASSAAGSRRGSADVGGGGAAEAEAEGGEGEEEGSQGSAPTASEGGVDSSQDLDDDDDDDDGGPNPAEDTTSPPEPSQQQQQPPPQPQAYMVTVPPGVRPGGHFPVMVAGQQLLVQCPHNARPGMNVRIVPPVVHQPPAPSPGAQGGTNLDRPPDRGAAGSGAEGPPRPQLTTQMFEVIVPAGVRPNQPFALIAGGQRVLVTCPPNAYPGQKIRFQLPVSQPSAKSIESVKLSYDGMQDGWIRTVRVTDMKFQWVRMDDKGDVDTDVRFDMRHSAYVRKLVFLEGNDPRMRTGYLSLVPASEAAVDSRVVAPGPTPNSGGREIVGYADLAAAQGRRYEDKARWFQDVCARLTADWNEGHMRINVRRPYLLQDSMSAVMSLGREDLRKIWRFEFMGEAGIDAGGLAREWFHLVTEQIFDPDNGLWMSSSGTQQMYMRINPASEISCPEDHLVYFRFLGRVMGKALFDRQLVSGHMVRHMYKHILGWPVGFDDLELFDEDYYRQLKKLAEYDDVSVMCLSFTVTEDALGAKREVDLLPDGSQIEVNNDNLPEYLEANLKYRMLDRVRPQLTELLLGFFDVIPEPLLTIFDYQELELLMCGLPTIDVDDWMANTNYTGSFEGTTAASGGSNGENLPPAAKWFWEAVRDDFDQEMRARLLQFVTGTSGVPSRGFSVLQGNDGNIRKFTVHGVDPAHYHYPRAHTCFNRIDLPMYATKEELLEKLRVAVSTSATGFDIE